jgi:hypothetical protein
MNNKTPKYSSVVLWSGTLLSLYFMLIVVAAIILETYHSSAASDLYNKIWFSSSIFLSPPAFILAIMAISLCSRSNLHPTRKIGLIVVNSVGILLSGVNFAFAIEWLLFARGFSQF